MNSSALINPGGVGLVFITKYNALEVSSIRYILEWAGFFLSRLASILEGDRKCTAV
jgi:hypothetical protein